MVTLREYLEYGVPSLAAMAVAWALAILVLRARPTRRIHRLVAAVLVMEGAANAFIAVAITDLFARVPEGSLLAVVSESALVAMLAFLPWTYLGIVACLDTPLVRWLRDPVWPALAVLPAAFTFALVFLPRHATEDGSPFATAMQVFVVVSVASITVFAVVAAISAWRRAPRGSPARSRAGAFAVAFVTRDVLFGLGFAVFILAAEGIGQRIFGEEFGWFMIAYTSPVAVLTLIYVPILAYGILRTQLFDIDLKIKKGIMRGSLMGFFVVAFFVAEQIGQAIISERAGPYVGLAGAGLLAVAIAPLRKLAKRIADTAMPTTDASTAYLAARKVQVYRAALEGAYEDGAVTEKERAILTRLAAELGIGPVEMVAIEEAVRTSSPGAEGVAA